VALTTLGTSTHDQGVMMNSIGFRYGTRYRYRCCVTSSLSLACSACGRISHGGIGYVDLVHDRSSSSTNIRVLALCRIARNPTTVEASLVRPVIGVLCLPRPEDPSSAALVRAGLRLEELA
jgi:hypothetical protein